jgi:GT2 family glycosyltransferase
VILAERLLEWGYRCACCSNTRIVHNHSYTVRKTLSKLKYVKSNLRSFDYYLKQYRRLPTLSRLLCDAFYGLKVLLLS